MMDPAAGRFHKERTGKVHVTIATNKSETPLSTSCTLFADEQQKLYEIVTETLEKDPIELPTKTVVGTVRAKSGIVEFDPEGCFV